MPTVGYLTVVEDEQHGLFGGYLLLNSNGRPLEFHCTTPVRANRAQEILYGPTLREYLCGEQIAAALVRKTNLAPRLICTDMTEVLAVRQHVDVPVIAVAQVAAEQPAAATTETTDGQSWRVDAAHAVVAPKSPAWFALAGAEVLVSDTFPQDRSDVLEIWETFAARIDLTEPFGRIQEAISEAQQSQRG
ncbi:hypothetical protein LOC68_20555 [Blastopirellula sp. JC732]|uniref:Uncharacterized protein n=1 Tax=Blastopirellula sediminis TaxID=2894196 RepID=A0A9X1SI31_9BACT|nr:hypothetical protein [Blastopirellula sediminis]MCC9605909.1 hypothetical protein [Blastopirellula sediminis]MCC9630792.1 hypothetical protein [Blastopirellula sediminis]